MSKNPSKATRAEQHQAKRLNGKRIGGPGQPDIQQGSDSVEVKSWSTPVHSGVIKDAASKKIKTVISTRSGFTKPAEELAKRLGIKLDDRKTRKR